MQPTPAELAEARALTAAKRRASRMRHDGKEGLDRELMLELVAIIESAAVRTARQAPKCADCTTPLLYECPVAARQIIRRPPLRAPVRQTSDPLHDAISATELHPSA